MEDQPADSTTPSTQDCRSPSAKPIDRWLGLAGIVVGIAFFLAPKTPTVVVLCCLAMFVLFIPPLINFWWVEDRRWRRTCAVLLWGMACLTLGRAAWPEPPARQLTAADIADEIERRSSRKVAVAPNRESASVARKDQPPPQIRQGNPSASSRENRSQIHSPIIPKVDLSDLEVTFTIPVNERPSRLQWRMDNRSANPVQKIIHHWMVWDLDKPQLASDGGSVGIQARAQHIEFINGRNFSTGHVIPIDAAVEAGDRVFGIGQIDCLGCKEKGYWLYFRQGQGGWYAESPIRGSKIPAINPDEDPESVIGRFAPHLKRMAIGHWAVSEGPPR